MDLTDPPLPPEIWAATPCAAQALIVAQRDRIRDLEARLGQDASNCSRPPSSDPPQALRQRQVLPSGRKRGGQADRRGAYRALLPVEQVEEVVVVIPEVCWHCGQPSTNSEGCRSRRGATKSWNCCHWPCG